MKLNYQHKNKNHFKTKKKKKNYKFKQIGGDGSSAHINKELKERLQFFIEPSKPIPTPAEIDKLASSIVLNVQNNCHRVYSNIEREDETIVDEIQNEVSVQGKRNFLFKYSGLAKSLGFSKGTVAVKPDEQIKDTFMRNFSEYSAFVDQHFQAATNTDAHYSNFSKDSELTVCCMHGFLDTRKNKAFSVVPANTVVCFATPLDNIIGIANSPQNSISSKFLKMSKELYVELFRKHLRLRDLGFGYLNNADKDLLWTSCLVDSMCYYPGQVYPNLSLELTHKDYLSNDLNDGVHFLNLVSQGGEFFVKEVSDPLFFDTERARNAIKTESSILNYELYDIVDNNPRNKNFRFIIALSCRSIFGETSNNRIKELIIHHEMLFYHINKSIIDGLRIPFSTRVDLFDFVCDFYTDKNFYLSNTKLLDRNPFKDSPNLKNLNFDSRLPSLQTLLKHIEGMPYIDLTPTEVNYLLNLSFKKLFLFLGKLDPIKAKMLIRRILQTRYRKVNSIFELMFGWLRHFTYYHEIKYSYQEEILYYMKELVDLFQVESGVANLFIQRNVHYFLYQVDSFRQTNTIFNDSILPGKDYYALTYDGIMDETIDDQLYRVKGKKKDIRLITLLADLLVENEDEGTHQIYENVRKLILGKGFNSILFETRKSKSLMEAIFMIFPNLEELVFKDCFLKFESTKIPRTLFNLNGVNPSLLTILTISNSGVSLDFNIFKNLEKLEIDRNSQIRFLNLSLPKLKMLTLGQLPSLNSANLKNLVLDSLYLGELGKITLQVLIGETSLLAIQGLLSKSIVIQSKKVHTLELSNVDMRFNQIKDFMPSTGGFSFRSKTPRSVSLNFVNLILEEETIEELKERMIRSFRNLKRIEINFLEYSEKGDSKPKKLGLIELTTSELNILSKKTQIKICQENYKRDSKPPKIQIDVT